MNSNWEFVKKLCFLIVKTLFPKFEVGNFTWKPLFFVHKMKTFWRHSKTSYMPAFELNCDCLVLMELSDPCSQWLLTVFVQYFFMGLSRVSDLSNGDQVTRSMWKVVKSWWYRLFQRIFNRQTGELTLKG